MRFRFVRFLIRESVKKQSGLVYTMSAGPRSFPIPGEILNSGEFFGLTYDQLLMIGSIPIVVMMFAIVSGVIPIWVSFVLGIITFLLVAIVVARAPEGQDPFTWAGASFKRRFGTNRYTLRPGGKSRGNITVLDVIQTADNPGEPSPEVKKKSSKHNKSESDTNSVEPSIQHNE